MQYTFFMSVNELRAQGIHGYTLRKYYCNARTLCSRSLLFVTLDNKIPVHSEDVAAIVSDIHFSRSGQSIVVVVDTIEDNSAIITDGKIISETLSKGGDFDVFFGKYGKFITLKKQPSRWSRRSYVVK